ncbi:MAG TPA: methyltransferase domain-containing protein [Pirellulales bacterium]
MRKIFDRELREPSVAEVERGRCPEADEPGHRPGSALATAEVVKSAPRVFFARVDSAVRRRCRAAWRSFVPSLDATSISAAIDWLSAYRHHAGLASAPGEAICPLLTAAAVPTLLSFGEVDLARRFTDWLRTIQRIDGSFPSLGCGRRSLLGTAHALSALLSCTAANLNETLAAERAAAWLASQIDAAGRFQPSGYPSTSIDHWAAPAIHVACLPPLRQASRALGVPAWEQAVVRAAKHLRRSLDWAGLRHAAHVCVACADAWLQLGKAELAHEIMRGLAAGHHRDPRAPSISGAALAHAALVWYKLAERRQADRALARLQSNQLPSGGFPASDQRGSARRESAWAWKYFLDASLARVQTSFEQYDTHLPDRIDPADGRFRAVRAWCGSLGDGPKIADVGCGSGRFLRELARCFPAARWIAIDPSQVALSRCVEATERRPGGLLRIPAGDGEFDGAMAVESLEHSLLPERAIRELCRVVRPGGRVLVIDKHLAKQRLSQHEPWEQWFLPETVSAWLAKQCRNVVARPIAHGTARRPDGLFWCWEATRG